MIAILIAATMADGRAWWEAQPSPPHKVIVVTPRSPHAARGCTADAIFSTPAATEHPRYDLLVDECLPACMWTS